MSAAGKTREAGWELGVRRTTSASPERTWLPPDDHRETTIQFTVRPVATGTALSFPQERMRDADECERRLEHWTGVVERLVRDLAAETGGI
jgi:hypothetical protein